MAMIWNSFSGRTFRLMAAMLAAGLAGPMLFCQTAGGGWADFLDWGGHLRLRASAADPETGSRLDILDKTRLYDTAFELRSKHQFSPSDTWQLDVHYEMLGTVGDTREANSLFLSRYPAGRQLVIPNSASDDRRLMDLSRVITRDDKARIYHRLDRLVLSARNDWSTLRLGRQALTWGNGLLFQPMDLFNPFSPTDFERDYKTGDDMVTLQTWSETTGEIQMLYVPRRNPATGSVKWETSSAAAKIHRYAGGLEMDLMTGVHYKDWVAGFGLVGYAGGAAWRLDATYTWLDDKRQHNGYASVCANLDYSWVWWGKNFYGWIEYYYTGLGTDDYEEAWYDSNLIERIRRGERFTLGRSYLDAQLRAELHPLVNAYCTLIVNTEDPSGIIQPRMVWDAGQNLQITAGMDLYWGGPDTEFGGGNDTPCHLDLPMQNCTLMLDDEVIVDEGRVVPRDMRAA